MNRASKYSLVRQLLVTLALAVFGFLVIPSMALAQSGYTQMSPGVAGERDARGRNPELFVTRVVGENGVKLLVDAHVPNSEYQQYPIKFEFYINRNFFISQIRSSELPGPVGVDIGPDLATPPFNFAVIAYVLHPTRSTHAMVTGAVYSTELGATFTCQALVTGALLGDGQSDNTFNSTPVAVNQSGENQLNFQTEGLAEDGSKLSYAGTLSLTDDSLTGTIQVGSGSDVQLVSVSGLAALENNSLRSFDVASSDGSFDLRCD